MRAFAGHVAAFGRIQVSLWATVVRMLTLRCCLCATAAVEPMVHRKVFRRHLECCASPIWQDLVELESGLCVNCKTFVERAPWPACPDCGTLHGDFQFDGKAYARCSACGHVERTSHWPRILMYKW